MKLLFTILLFYSSLLFPQQSKLSNNVNRLSSYISSDYFLNLKNKIGHIGAVDSIYIEALKITDKDYTEALLALTFTTVPYRQFPMTLPLLNIELLMPLISADEDIFLRKNRNLPGNLFFDSPENDYGDKDKLAHFFGSAFLSFESRLFDLGKLIGYFVEAFEESFKVQSKVDERDLDVNEYGRLFGTLLKSNKEILPSQIFLFRSLRHFKFTL